MAKGEEEALVQCGREIGASEIDGIKDVCARFPALGMDDLRAPWVDDSDWRPQAHSEFEVAGEARAPGTDTAAGEACPLARHRSDPPRRTKQSNPGNRIRCGIGELGPVALEVVTSREAAGLWNEYVERYHYLGYKKPFGCVLRYFIVSKERRRLGCLLMAGAAKSLGARDKWIGWSERQRLRNLPWLISNSRYLIFPWVQVKHLASHVLAQLARRVRADWEERWGYRPVLMETFVDPARYPGTCYRAAGWIHLGQTTGAGLVRPGCEYKTTRKMIYVKPLVGDFREQLCNEGLTGRVIE